MLVLNKGLITIPCSIVFMWDLMTSTPVFSLGYGWNPIPDELASSPMPLCGRLPLINFNIINFYPIWFRLINNLSSNWFCSLTSLLLRVSTSLIRLSRSSIVLNKSELLFKILILENYLIHQSWGLWCFQLLHLHSKLFNSNPDVCREPGIVISGNTNFFASRW